MTNEGGPAEPETVYARPSDLDAMTHLGNILYMLADLHPDDRCDALDNALLFYNEAMPDQKVMPSGIGYQRLVDPPLLSEQVKHPQDVRYWLDQRGK